MQKRVLVVDDIDFVLALQKELFSEIEKELSVVIEVVTASSVVEALTALKKGTFSCLITDMNLPDGDGSQIAAYALEHSPKKIKLVALTSMPAAFDEKRELFDLFLTKPTLPRALKKDLIALVKS